MPRTHSPFPRGTGPSRPERQPAPRPERARRFVPLAGAVAVVLAIAVVLAVLTGTRPDQQKTGVVSTRPAPGGAPTGSGEGLLAHPFSATTLSGATFSVPAGKPTALLFLASNCPTCIAPAITLNRIERDVGDLIAVLGVDINPTDTEAEVAEFIKLAGNPRYGFVVDRDGRLTTAYELRAESTMFVLDASGRIVLRADEESDEAVIRRALAAAGLR